MNRTSTAFAIVLTGSIIVLASAAGAAGADYPSEWSSLDCADLTALAQQTFAEPSASREQKSLLASYIAAKYLSDAAVVLSVNPGQWRDIVTSVKDDLPASDREAWRRKLRSAHIAKGEMSYDDLATVQWVLKMLGDRHIWLFAAEWVKSHESWRSWEADELRKLGKILGAGYSTKEEGVIEGRRIVTEHIAQSLSLTRKLSVLSSLDIADLSELVEQVFHAPSASSEHKRLLASHVAMRYLASSDRSNWGKWLHLLYTVVGSLPDNSKSLTKKAIQEVLAGDEGSVRQLAEPSLMALGDVLMGLALKDLAASCAAAWVDANPGLDNVSIAGLTRMAKLLQGSGHAKARMEIAGVVAARYLSDEAVTRSVSTRQWTDIVTSVKDDLPASDREAWRRKLRSAHSAKGEMSYGDLATIQWALNMLGDRHIWLFAAEWVKSHESWRSWESNQLGKLSNILGARYQTKEEGVIEGRRIVTEHIVKRLSEAEKPVVTYGVLRSHGYAVQGEHRAALAARLRSESEGREIGAEDLAAVAGSLWLLGDADADGFVAGWLAKTNQWKSWPAGDYIHVAQGLMGNTGSATEVRRKLADQLISRHLTDVKETRSVGLDQWAQIVGAFGRDLPRQIRTWWASRLLAAYEADRWTLLDKDLSSLGRCLRMLGAFEMASAMSADRKSHHRLAECLGEEAGESPVWRDSAWQRLCWSVIATTPNQRSTAWQEGVHQLSSDSVLPPRQIVAAVDELTNCLGEDASDGLPPGQVLVDLLRLSRDYEVREGLYRRAEHRQLRAHIEALPAVPKGKVTEATKLVDAGKATEAIAAYNELLDREGLAASGGAVPLLRAELLSLLLEQEPVDLGAADKHMNVLAGTGESISARVWNLACRVLMYRVLQARRADRPAVWSDGVKLLSSGTDHISAETFSGLDSLLASLTAENGPIAHRALADLILLSPDLASMVRLQQRRVVVFASEGNWQEAKTAAALCVVMANATPDGPVGCVSRCAEIMELAGAPSQEVESFKAIWAAKGAEVGGAPTVTIDSVLAGAAKAILETATEELPPRRQAYLHLYAGQAKKALGHIHAALIRAKDGYAISDRLDDVQVILSTGGCGLWDSDSFSHRLVSVPARDVSPTTQPDNRCDSLLGYLVELELGSGGTEGSIQPRQAGGAGRAYSRMSRSGRAGMAGKHLARRRGRLIRWGAGALRDKEVTWSRNCLAAAMNMQEEPEEATLAIDSAVAAAVCAEGAKDVVQFLETVVPLVHSTAGRRHLLCGLAVAHYNQGAYEECLKCLKSADSLAAGSAEEHDMASGILQARSLIELARYEDAADALAEMQDWPGTPEQHARALFLTGWTHLQSNDVPRASSAFRQVVDRFAETEVADEAARVLDALKGT